MEKERIDQYFKYKEVIKRASDYMKEVEKDVLEEAEKMKETSKDKTFRFDGTGASFIEVVEAEKLDMVSPSALMSYLNNNADAFIKGEMKYSIDNKFVKLVRDVVAGNYVDTTFEDAVKDVVSGLSDESTKKVLTKKLKGVYTKDVVTLRTYGNQNPEVDAYMLQEAKAYSNVSVLASAYGYEVADFIEHLRSLMFVDTTLKIKATAGDDEE